MRRFLGYKKEGGNKEEPNGPPNLRQSSNQLEKRGNHLNSKLEKIDQEILQIKQKIRNTRSNVMKKNLKRRALMLLRQKKMYEKHQESTLNQQMTMESMAITNESMKMNVESFKLMESNNKFMKKQMKNFSVDKVLDMRDEMEELMLDQEEINESLARVFEVPDGIDEDELMEEFDELEDEMGMEDTSGALDSIDMPSSNVGMTANNASDDAKELENELMQL